MTNRLIAFTLFLLVSISAYPAAVTYDTFDLNHFEIQITGVSPNISHLIRINTNNFPIGGGGGGGADTNWTNSAGVVQLVQPTNNVFLRNTNSAGVHTIDFESIISGPIPDAVGLSAYAGIYEIDSLTDSLTTITFALSGENYIKSGNAGPVLEDEKDAAIGLGGYTFGGGAFSILPSGAVSGASYGVQGFGYSGYNFQGGVMGGAFPQRGSGQTNFGGFFTVTMGALSGSVNTAVYGGLFTNPSDKPQLIDAGGLFDAGPNAEPALVARKNDGTSALAVDSTGNGTFGFTIAVQGIKTTTTNYTASATDYFVRCDTSGGNRTVTLPATPTTGKLINVKKITTDSNIMTVNGNGANIDGAATVVTSGATLTSFQMQFNGSTWDIQ